MLGRGPAVRANRIGRLYTDRQVGFGLAVSGSPFACGTQVHRVILPESYHGHTLVTSEQTTMPKTAKISISLPDDVLSRADRNRSERGESRSEFFRRALEALFREEERRAAVDRYVAGYVAESESEYEIDTANAAAAEAWGAQEWDEGNDGQDAPESTETEPSNARETQG